MTEPEAPVETDLPPRALIQTVAGLYVREAGGWISVSRLIRLLEPLDVDAQAVRAAVSRLKKRGFFEGERRDGVAGYALSEYALSLLAIGDARTLDRPQEPEDLWVLAVFSVPESDRDKRHLLRARLAWLGFGNVSSGVWIAPDHITEDARKILAREGLAPYLDLFRAKHVGYGDLEKRVQEWWDLETLDALHRAFIEAQEPTHRRWATRDLSQLDEREAYHDYVVALTNWRRLPYLDPCLPLSLLPPTWSGTAAAELFFDLRRRLEGPAKAYVAGTEPHR